MTLRKSLSATAIALVLAAPLAAEELRFTVWTGNDAHLAMLNGIAESFKASHPEATVTFETIPAGDYIQKLTFQLAGGNPPDLGWMFEDSMPAFVAAGAVQELTPALEAAEGYDLADFSEPAMGLWKDGDAIYGVPFSTSPFMIYYNKDMFDAAGLEDPLALAAKGEWDMDKFREVAKALKDSGAPYGFEFKDGQGYDTRIMHAIMPPIRAYGGYAWKDGECGFNKPEAVAAITQLHEMVFEDGSIVPPGEQGDYFSGGAAMTINQISRASRMAEAGFNWGIAPLPTGPAGASPIIGQAGLVVFSESDQPELAKAFIAHMTNAENVAVMAQFFPPARKSVLGSAAFTEANKLIPAEQMANVSAAIEEGNVLPSHQNSPQIGAALKPRFDALWRADADVQASLDAVCDAIQGNL
ncbi:ABC transporter substrate-binding protein [Vannielia litorea]|uniref:Carbohydrate ABC transporter substrate-binding protein, CUT1 family n=1 Tax=Vannielia litorea TaxID=1217970 RepID=A0A1N6E2K9_9RHOB|nr:sugar ABC transporter substrate-binding protein [Vannielia litorea]SIN77222.1 carbohydrate ABC transporter substrate-binding protein, CUT1 family [Vannielia litorea]